MQSSRNSQYNFGEKQESQGIAVFGIIEILCFCGSRPRAFSFYLPLNSVVWLRNINGEYVGGPLYVGY